MIYGVVAILGGLFFLYRIIVQLFIEHRTVQAQKEIIQAQEQEFNDQVTQSEEEIKNAKLRYSAARKQLDDPPNAG